jgi:hypothetical protein
LLAVLLFAVPTLVVPVLVPVGELAQAARKSAQKASKLDSLKKVFI